MAGRVLAAVALILAGSVLSVPIAILLGVVMLLLDVVHAAWARGGLVGIRYRRHLGARRSPFGETIPLEIEVWNRRRLPLAWLRADDEASAGVEVRERAIEEGERARHVRPAQRVDPPAVGACAAPLSRLCRPARRVHPGPGGPLDR